MRIYALVLGMLFILFTALSLRVGAEGINYEPFPEKLLLRMETRSDYLSELEKLTRIPEFSLYGDGSVFYSRIEAHDDKMVIYKANLSPDELQEMLSFIQNEGILEWEDILEKCPLPNMSTTIFTLQSLSRSRKIKIYALPYCGSMGQIPAGVDNVYRKIANFSHPTAELYKPTRVRIYARRIAGDVDRSRFRIDPWKSGLNLSKVKGQSSSPDFHEETVEGKHLPGILKMLDGKVLFSRKVINVFFSQKKDVYQVGFKPLLPDE